MFRRLALCGLLAIGGCLCGCTTTMSQEDMAVYTDQVTTLVKAAQDLGLDANAAVWVELGEDIGSWKTAITGPIKARAFVQITARPKE